MVGDEFCIVGEEIRCSSSKSEEWHNEYTMEWMRYLASYMIVQSRERSYSFTPVNYFTSCCYSLLFLQL